MGSWNGAREDSQAVVVEGKQVSGHDVMYAYPMGDGWVSDTLHQMTPLLSMSTF